MRRSLLSLALTSALAAGCAPGNPGLVVSNVIDPDDQCVYAIGGIARTIGYFDVGVPNNSYEAAFRFLNQLMNLSQSGVAGFPPMADPNVIQVQALEVEIRDIGNRPLAFFDGANPFTVPVGGVAVPSGDGMQAGEGLGFAQIIPPVYAADLGEVAGTDAMIVVSVRAIGRTAGGAEVVSDEFIFPVQLCSGCLSVCLTDDMGEPLCRPTCLPGQDNVHIACDASCIAGRT